MTYNEQLYLCLGLSLGFILGFLLAMIILREPKRQPITVQDIFDPEVLNAVNNLERNVSAIRNDLTRINDILNP